MRSIRARFLPVLGLLVGVCGAAQAASPARLELFGACTAAETFRVELAAMEGAKHVETVWVKIPSAGHPVVVRRPDGTPFRVQGRTIYLRATAQVRESYRGLAAARGLPPTIEIATKQGGAHPHPDRTGVMRPIPAGASAIFLTCEPYEPTDEERDASGSPYVQWGFGAPWAVAPAP